MTVSDTYETGRAAGAFGTATIRPTKRDHVFVEYPDGVTINRVLHPRAHGHVHLHSDGQWRVGSEDDLPYQRVYHYTYLRKLSRGGIEDGSESARRKFAAEIEQAVTAWAADNRGLIEQAHDDYVRGAQKRVREKIAEHEAAIADLQGEYTELEFSLSCFSGTAG